MLKSSLPTDEDTMEYTIGATQIGDVITKMTVFGLNIVATGTIVMVAIISIMFRRFKYGFVDVSLNYHPYELM